MSLVLYPPDKRFRDADNLIKVVNDFLQRVEVIENDHFQRKLSVEWGEGGESRVEIAVASV